MDGAAGGVEDGARPRRRVRREDAPSLVRLARVLRRLPGRARRPTPAALGPKPRPRCAPRVHGLARFLRPRRDLPQRPARLSGSRIPARAQPLGWVRPARQAARVRVADLGACGCGRLPPRVPGRAQPRSAARRDRRRARRVVGASRILDGEAPYGNMPQRGDLEPCGPKDADGQVRERIQTNGRCEAGIERGDTYGPVSYLAYVPAVAIFAWSGKWDSLPAAHATSIGFDLLAVLALVLVGLRFGGRRLAVLLAFAWAAYPFTAYTLNANTNDAIMPAFLLARFLARHVRLGARRVGRACGLDEVRRAARRAAVGDVPGLRATARAPLRYRVPRRERARVLDPAPRAVAVEAARTFWERTIGFQSGRDSPFSIWGWGQYHARGIPDLGFLQPVVVVLAVALAVPRGGRPAAQEPAPAGRAHGCGARRLPAHADPLVLPLPPVGRPLRLPVAAPSGAEAIRTTGTRSARSRTPCRSRRRTRRPRPRSARRPEPSRSAREGRCASGGSRAPPPRR